MNEYKMFSSKEEYQKYLIKKAKAEAVKEFAERLKAETKGLLGANFVDDILKEMVGEDK